MIKGFKIQIYPNKKQEEILWKQIYGCRFIWNYMLDLEEENYKNGEKFLGECDLSKEITKLKADEKYEWLKEVGIHSMQHICKDLAQAYKMFFNKKAEHPKYRTKKKSKNSFPVDSARLWFDDKAHISKVGKVRYRTDFNIPKGSDKKFSNGVITFTGDEKWILSFGMEIGDPSPPKLTDKSMGIDLGIKETATVAFGDECIKFHNINKSKQAKDLEKRIKHLQRSIARKYEANKQGNKYMKTKNIVKEEKELRRLNHHLQGIRQNYNHQMTHALVSMLPARVVMEDLNVKGMMKNKHLSRAITSQNFYKIRYQMIYKCSRLGIEIIFADRYYPSSKTCSNCGCINKNLKLKDRTYVCPDCGTVIDRDYNAALNLSRYRA